MLLRTPIFTMIMLQASAGIRYRCRSCRHTRYAHATRAHASTCNAFVSEGGLRRRQALPVAIIC
jgi:hypothetical protein